MGLVWDNRCQAIIQRLREYPKASLLLARYFEQGRDSGMKRSMIISSALATSVLTLAACGGSSQQTTQPQPQPQPRPQVYQEWVDLPVRILFANGSAALTPENQRLLDEAVDLVRHRNDIVQIEVRGHTDSRGGDNTNRDLSQQRAEAVKQFLMSRGVPPQIVVARGYSESAPLTSNTSASDRAQNRRVDFRALVQRQYQRTAPQQGQYHQGQAQPQYQQGQQQYQAPPPPPPQGTHYNNGY